MKKRASKIRSVRIVPNSAAAGKLRLSNKGSAVKQLEAARKANAATKIYKAEKAGKHWVIVVQEKQSGKTVTFDTGSTARKRPALRKLSFAPKRGTVPIKRILEVI
jgi:hypothetical protein